MKESSLNILELRVQQSSSPQEGKTSFKSSRCEETGTGVRDDRVENMKPWIASSHRGSRCRRAEPKASWINNFRNLCDNVCVSSKKEVQMGFSQFSGLKVEFEDSRCTSSSTLQSVEVDASNLKEELFT